MFLARFVQACIDSGRLTIIDASGQRITVGPDTGPEVVIRLHDPALARQLVVNPHLHLGEAYTDGRLTIEKGTLYDLLDLCMEASNKLATRWPFTWIDGAERLARIVRQYNPIPRSQDNVAHHYNLSDELFELFLDADRQYSCGYFNDPEVDLDQAQIDKKRHLAAKLRLEPGMRVLDIGSGWGGLAMYLGRLGCRVTGITLSTEQLDHSRRAAAEAGLARMVNFELCDYRQVTRSFDRIVSVGMFEHVGINNYATFFAKLRDLLNDDGVAVIHSIGRATGPYHTDAWIRKYIFPGGYSPALSEVVPLVEREGLWITDIEILRLHYAHTLRAWRQRFDAGRARAAELYDEQFCRMWDYYLTASELAFRKGGHMVFQIQLTREQTAVPLTRDYITDWERRNGDSEIVAAE